MSSPVAVGAAYSLATVVVAAKQIPFVVVAVVGAKQTPSVVVVAAAAVVGAVEQPVKSPALAFVTAERGEEQLLPFEERRLDDTIFEWKWQRQSW